MFEAWRRNVDVRTYITEDMQGKEKEMLSAAGGVRRQDIRRSGELAVPVITDILLDRKGWRESVNVLNAGGFIENLDRDTAVELPATVDASGVHPDAVGRLPEGFASLIRQQQGVQRLLVQAYRERSRKLLLQALLIDPVASGHARQVEQMLDHMLRIQSGYLPQFS
jgi:alpha-galactosidase